MLKTTTKPTREAKLPAYNVYHVIETGNREHPTRWQRVGVVFAHQDHEGGTLLLDTLPINFDGRLILRAPKLDEAE